MKIFAAFFPFGFALFSRNFSVESLVASVQIVQHEVQWKISFSEGENRGDKMGSVACVFREN